MSPKLADPLYIALKAAAAALLSVLVVDLLGITDRLSAPFVAVVCIAPSVYGGVRRGFEQLAASVLGGGIAVILAVWLPLPAALVVATFATVWLCFQTGLGTAYIVGAFTVFYVLLIPSESAGVTLEHRLASVVVGAVAALGMNVLVSLFRLRAVLRRRLTIAREALAKEWASAADLLERPEAAAAPEPFDALFPLLRALQEELLDARAEGRFRSRSFRAEVDEALRTARRMVAVAHHGTDLVLASSTSMTPRPLAATAARTLAEEIQRDARMEADPAVEDDVRRSFAEARRWWNEGRTT